MPNRVIKESVNESRGLSGCSFFAQDLYKRLITYADDYGRFNADPQIMLARLYPREIDVVSIADVVDGLVELSGVGKIAFYSGSSIHENKVYGCFPKWNEHQRVRDSKKKCPDPDNTSINDWYLKRFIPIEMRIAIIERDDFTCQECGERIVRGLSARALIKMGTGMFHIDHIVPVCQGGRATMENLRLTCAKCNLSRKRMFTFDEILQFADKNRDPQKSAASCGELPPNPIQSNPNPESNPYPNPDARAMISDDATAIQRDHDRILEAAQSAGFKCTNAERAKLLNLYAQYGNEKMLAAIDKCVTHSATNIAYLTAVLKGTPKKKGNATDIHGYDQRDYSGEQKKAMERMMTEEWPDDPPKGNGGPMTQKEAVERMMADDWGNENAGP